MTDKLSGDERAWQVIVEGYLDALWEQAVAAGADDGQAASACEVTFLRLLEAFDNHALTATAGSVTQWLSDTLRQELRRVMGNAPSVIVLPDIRLPTGRT